MKKKIHIEIPKPCHEDWNKMTPHEQGRFCMNCQKTVTDFTNKTNAEIINILSKQKNTCGRFLPHQLNKTIYAEGYASTPKWKLYLFSLFTFLSIESAIAQDTPKEKTIQGRIVDDMGYPLSGASVYVLGAVQIGTVSNKNGEFVLKNIPETANVVFSLPGMEEQIVSVENQNNFFIKLETSLELSTVGELLIRPPFFERIWLFISWPFRKKCYR